MISKRNKKNLLKKSKIKNKKKITILMNNNPLKKKKNQIFLKNKKSLKMNKLLNYPSPHSSKKY
jgi:hypothetical protein